MRLITRNLLAGSLSFIAVAAAACLPFPGDILYEGECLKYSSTVDAPICAGSFFVQEAFIQRLTNTLRIEDVCPVRYSWVESTAEYCNDHEDIKGCTVSGTVSVYSSMPIHDHEIVHAVMTTGGLAGPSAFQEGFASAFGYPHTSAARIEVSDILAWTSWMGSPRAYYTMGLFVRFLVERHGLDAILEFMRCTDRGDAREDYAPVFAEVVGESLEDAISAFFDYPDCQSSINRFALYECALAPIPWSEGQWSTGSVSVDCARDDVVGPETLADEPRMWTTRSFDIDEPGEYWLFGWDAGLAAGADAWGDIRVTRCGSCVDGFNFFLNVDPDAPVIRHLPAGRYYVELFRRVADGPGEMGVVIVPGP